MGWPAAGQPSQPEPGRQQTALAQQAWHTLLGRSSPSRAAQSRLGRPAELGAATNCREGKEREEFCLPPTKTALPQGMERSGQLASSCHCCWPGASEMLVLVILWLGDPSGQDTQKEQTTKGDQTTAWWRWEKHNETGQHPALSPETTNILATPAHIGTAVTASRRWQFPT